MRWFSFNETAKWYHGNSEDGQLSGQLWATKMILEYHFKQQGANCDEQAEPTPQLPVSESDPKEELRKLRAQTGALRLTPTLITDSNVCGYWTSSWQCHLQAGTPMVKKPNT